MLCDCRPIHGGETKAEPHGGLTNKCGKEAVLTQLREGFEPKPGRPKGVASDGGTRSTEAGEIDSGVVWNNCWIHISCRADV